MTTSPQKKVGSAAERAVAKLVGGIRVGMDGGPVDVVMPAYASIQVKNLKAMPSMTAVDGMLKAMPSDPLRAVVVIQRAGSGRRGIRTITFELDEWAKWHGGTDVA